MTKACRLSNRADHALICDNSKNQSIEICCSCLTGVLKWNGRLPANQYFWKHPDNNAQNHCPVLCLLISGRMAAQDYNVSIYTSGNGFISPVCLPFTSTAMAIYGRRHPGFPMAIPSPTTESKTGWKKTMQVFFDGQPAPHMGQYRKQDLSFLLITGLRKYRLKAAGTMAISMCSRSCDSTILFSGDLGTYAYNGKRVCSLLTPRVSLPPIFRPWK